MKFKGPKRLFEVLDEQNEVPETRWTPDEPPSLDGVDDIAVNVETDGLKWFDGNLPIALSVYAKDRSWYLPWRHRGGNLDEAVVKRWAERELQGKRIYNINIRFDIHMFRAWGINLESQGNSVSDVGHSIALLDDHRMPNRLSLDSIIEDYLAEAPMPRLDESLMVQYHAGQAQARARYNVEAVWRLKDTLRPMLEQQDLMRVHDLEDKVIWPVVEMEKNGSPINEELLDRWYKDSERKVNAMLSELAQTLGWQCNPDSPTNMERAFLQLKLPIVRTGNINPKTKKNPPSFTDAILKRIDHPTVKLMRRIIKLSSLRSKFIVDTKKGLVNGTFYYALHQLRASKDEHDSDRAGTVTGRFSSTKIAEGVGGNVQQRIKAARQRVAAGYDEDDSSHDDEIYLVRKLHVAAKGQSVISSDMDQAQYRIFAHYVNNPKINEAYRKNPKTSFHDHMYAQISPYVESFTYRQQKDLNFAVIFGAKLFKRAVMLGHITAQQYEELKEKKDYNSPLLAKTREVSAIYDREVPEVEALLAMASHLGAPECSRWCRRTLESQRLHRQYEHQGYVTTYLGRRMRFPDGNRLHKAFNGMDQGTEADYMKTKLVEIHERRHETGFTLRITNHDELVGDGDLETARKVDAILNTQSFDLRIPLTWSTGIGPSWAEVEDIDGD